MHKKITNCNSIGGRTRRRRRWKEKRNVCKKGDKVVINSYAGTTIKYEGEELIIVKQADILAIVE